MTRPQTRRDIPTPALVIDAAALERNLRRMAEYFAAGPCRLRPHFKAHKTPAIARLQLAAGSCTGLTCATVSEVEAVAAFCDDVLLANEIVSAERCDRMAALARDRKVTVAVDSVYGLEQIAGAARRAGVRIGVLVDVDVGQGRCGVPPGEPALTLAGLAAATDGVELRGIMGYEGHVQPIRARPEREAAARAAMSRLVATAARLRDAGLPCDVVSAGGTGTYDISSLVEGVTEIQAGSYVLMDTDYAAVGVPFEHAFFVLGTVISRPAPDRLVADCGHKSVTKDHGPPAVRGLEGATITALNDEHAVIAVPPEARIAVGDRIELLPSHTDPTTNLHDVFYVLDGEHVVDIWPIVARGYPEHRLAAENRAASTTVSRA